MKKHILTSCFLLIVLTCTAQVPQGINYQGIATDNSGVVFSNNDISLRISIIDQSPQGNIVYAENHTVRTNDFGLFNVVIGQGNQEINTFDNIAWSNGDKFLQIEVDLSGGNSYQLLGITQFLSVPFALYALETAQDLSAGEGISIENNNIINNAPDKEITLTGEGTVQVTGGYPDFTISSPELNLKIDSDSTNELQTLTLNNNVLSISDGNSVQLNLNSGEGGIQNYFAGEGIAIQNDSIINTRPNQELKLTGEGSAEILGNYPNFTITTPLVPEITDSDSTNELQTLSLNNNILSISNGNSVQLNLNSDEGGVQSYFAGEGIAIQNDSIINTNPNQELQLSGEGSAEISGNYPNFTITTPPVPEILDNDSTNELQTLSYQNNTLSISDGNDILFDPTPWAFNNNNIYFNGNYAGLGLTNPNYKLDIATTTQGLDDRRTLLNLKNNSTDEGSLARITIRSGNSGKHLRLLHISSSYGQDRYKDFGQVVSNGSGLVLGAFNSNGIIKFETGSDGEFPFERMRLDNIGNLGIGTQNPTNKLHIESTSQGVTDERTLLRLKNNSTDFGSLSRIVLEAGNSGSKFMINSISSSYGQDKFKNFGSVVSNGAGVIFSANNANGVLKFQTGTDGEFAIERMRIDQNGNIGIGTEAPNAKLEVTNGDVYINDVTKGIIMRTPNGNCFRITLDENGDFVKTQIACP